MTAEPLLEVDHLTVTFPVTGGVFLRRVGEVRAVDDVSLTLHRGETLGLVGESGCGKSTLVRTITRLLDPTGGIIRLGGREWARPRQRQDGRDGGKESGDDAVATAVDGTVHVNPPRPTRLVSAARAFLSVPGPGERAGRKS